MNWTALLTSSLEDAFQAAEGLVGMVDEDALDWKPDTGDNWMTSGQLLQHLGEACGAGCKGFVTGDWGMPDGMDMAEMSLEDMLPPAEAMASVSSVEEARQRLAADKQLAIEMIAAAGDRMDERMPAPWDPRLKPLGGHMLNMINHLDHHKAQLFYYLKLQGKPVNTMDFYGNG